MLKFWVTNDYKSCAWVRKDNCEEQILKFCMVFRYTSLYLGEGFKNNGKVS